MQTTMVRERPILFSAPMVRALLDGTKTQTRRVVKAPGVAYPGYDARADECLRCPYGAPGDRLWVRETWTADFEWIPNPGHSLLLPWHSVPAGWRGVKNAQRLYYAADDLEAEVYANDDGTRDLVTTGERAGTRRWASPIHMPRWASRLTLELTDVRLARVQDISDADAEAEGAEREFRTVIPMGGKPEGVSRPYTMPVSHRAGFANLWSRLNDPRGFGWDANPWVWVLSFRRVTA